MVRPMWRERERAVDDGPSLPDVPVCPMWRVRERAVDDGPSLPGVACEREPIVDPVCPVWRVRENRLMDPVRPMFV